MIGFMTTELQELLALHNRVLAHCWQSLGRIERAETLFAHVRSLESAERQLQRILRDHAASLAPEIRREVVRTLARVDCFVRSVRAGGGPLLS